MHLIDRIAYTNRLADRSGLEKMLFAVGMIVMALAVPPWPADVVIIAVMTGAVIGVARVPARQYVRLLAAPLLFLAVGILPLVVSIDFGGRLPLGFGWTPDGGALALRVVLRSLAGVSCLFFLALSTPVPQVLGVLRRLRTPPALTELALLIYRYIWVFLDTVSAIRGAQSARLGYRSLRSSYRSVSMLVAAFFGQTLERARAMDHGLQARNWQGELRVLDEAASASPAGLAVVVTAQALTLVVALTLWRLV